MSRRGEVRCCEGCGKDTRNTSGLCFACTPGTFRNPGGARFEKLNGRLRYEKVPSDEIVITGSGKAPAGFVPLEAVA